MTRRGRDPFERLADTLIALSQQTPVAAPDEPRAGSRRLRLKVRRVSPLVAEDTALGLVLRSTDDDVEVASGLVVFVGDVVEARQDADGWVIERAVN